MKANILYQITSKVKECEEEIKKISPHCELRVFFKKEAYDKAFNKLKKSIDKERVESIINHLCNEKNFKETKVRFAICYVLKNDIGVSQELISKYFLKSHATISRGVDVIDFELKIGYDDVKEIVAYTKSILNP